MITFRFLLKDAKKYSWPLTVTVVSMVLLVGVQLLAPQLVRRMVATVTNPETGQEGMATVARLAGIALIVYVLRGGLQFLRSYMAHLAGWSVVADSRRRVYAHLQRLSLRFYEDKQVGQLMSRLVNDSDLFESLIAHAVPDTLVNVLTFAGVTLILANMNWQLTLLSLVPAPLLVIAVRGFSKYVRPAFRERQKELGELNAALNENLSGIREIKAFTREDIEMSRIGERIDTYRDSLLRALRLMATFHPLVDFSSALGTIVLIYFGGRLVLMQVLPIEDLVAFFLYLELLYQPIRALAGAWENVQQARAGADRVIELLDEDPEADDSDDAQEISGRSQGALRFEDVGFQYREGTSVLSHIDLDIRAGHVIALVGPTGVGKSTLVSLIPRFYEMSEGRIWLDGVDTRSLQLRSLREQISMVLQDVFLFHGTVRENLMFGRSTATEDEMVAAAKAANAHEFIVELPVGYDTLIGERGVKLSGGQKQRISIGRAVLKDAPILVLDEATSSVDTETELLIQQALERLMIGRTTIIIAHRLSTVRNADKIVVLEGDRITQLGTHQELIACEGLYRHLNDVQGESDQDLAVGREG
ncbi:MAG: ABC transporter ATP-binding protein/permease [Anaerolineae bacterium]|nr:ABC transporter ATP-binding protein/permease [Anaerolineae bacterium]